MGGGGGGHRCSASVVWEVRWARIWPVDARAAAGSPGSVGGGATVLPDDEGALPPPPPHNTSLASLKQKTINKKTQEFASNFIQLSVPILNAYTGVVMPT